MNAFTAAQESGLSGAQMETLSKKGEILSKLRKNFPQLTDIHENEIFSELNENAAKLDQNAKNIAKKIADTVTRFDFDPTAKLGVVKEAQEGPVNKRSEIDSQIEKISKRLREIAKATKTRIKKDSPIISGFLHL